MKVRHFLNGHHTEQCKDATEWAFVLLVHILTYQMAKGTMLKVDTASPSVVLRTFGDILLKLVEPLMLYSRFHSREFWLGMEC